MPEKAIMGISEVEKMLLRIGDLLYAARLGYIVEEAEKKDSLSEELDFLVNILAASQEMDPEAQKEVDTLLEKAVQLYRKEGF